jgi:bifunctional N-acetylglucosamine-1-phosphate-uridyltransferase/glucosamine-1-phosphate-acetyltransferase GlmU-like protein
MDLLIIAAGNSKRMGSLPKSVSLVNGKPNLYNTVELAKKYFDTIYIFSNEETKPLFKEVIYPFKKKCDIIPIKSGKGCGDAVLTALEVLGGEEYRGKSVVCWGDVYFETDEIFAELKDMENTDAPLLIPAKYEDDPYVWFYLKEDGAKIISSNFKKRGEVSPTGHHDQSIFLIDNVKMYKTLKDIKKVLSKNDTYLHGEMIFLDSVNYLNNIEDHAMIYETKHPTKGYNTQSELDDINNFYKKVKNNS